MEILNDEQGVPSLKISGEAEEILNNFRCKQDSSFDVAHNRSRDGTGGFGEDLSRRKYFFVLIMI